MVNQQVTAQALGIEVASKTEPALFEWLLACLLFSAPLQPATVEEAYKMLTNADITSLNVLAKTDWDRLVSLLDQAGCGQHSASLATKLLHTAGFLEKEYGSVTELLEQSGDAKDLEARLLALKDIGPVAAEQFVEGVGQIWFDTPTHDFDAATVAAGILTQHGYAAYIIGGAVRDLYIGLEPKDFDLATNATPEQITAIADFRRSKYKDTAQAYGVTRVVFEHGGRDIELEVATFRKDLEAHKGRKATKVAYTDLEDDVLRRDFTINALALDTATNFIIDYVGGLEDIDGELVRFIGKPEERIREDPLRIMRAIRFKNTLGFFYNETTAKAIRSAVKEGYITKIAPDRLRDELTRLLVHQNRRQAVFELREFGILEQVLPEVARVEGVEQPPEFHAEGDVWQHELLILDHLPPHPSKRLVWAALLHDIGKGPTLTQPRSVHDRIRFNRHYAVGADMARAILLRLNFSNRDTDDIYWLIYNHMAIDDLPAMRPGHQQRMLGHRAFEDLLELHRADAAASWRPGEPHGLKPKFRDIERLWHNYQSKPPELQQPSLKRDVGIDGTWLQEQFGREFELTGPVIGRTLAALNEWYRDEGSTDRQAYEQKARKLLGTLAKKRQD